jgi:hypothetical protein
MATILCAGLMATQGNGNFEYGETQLYRTIEIDETFVSEEGCKVHTKGEVTYTLIPPEITDFSGTVTISGPDGCPDIVLNFGMVGGSGGADDIGVSFDSNNPCETSQVYWSNGPDEVLALLNSSQANQVIVNEVNELCSD